MIRSEKKRLNSYKVDLEKVRSDFFPHVEKNHFIKTWTAFSETVGLPDTLRDDDTIKSLSNLFMFSELFYEDLEDFFRENNVTTLPKDLSSYLVRDVLNLLFENPSKTDEPYNT